MNQWLIGYKKAKYNYRALIGGDVREFYEYHMSEFVDKFVLNIIAEVNLALNNYEKKFRLVICGDKALSMYTSMHDNAISIRTMQYEVYLWKPESIAITPAMINYIGTFIVKKLNTIATKNPNPVLYSNIIRTINGRINAAGILSELVPYNETYNLFALKMGTNYIDIHIRIQTIATDTRKLQSMHEMSIIKINLETKYLMPNQLQVSINDTTTCMIPIRIIQTELLDTYKTTVQVAPLYVMQPDIVLIDSYVKHTQKDENIRKIKNVVNFPFSIVNFAALQMVDTSKLLDSFAPRCHQYFQTYSKFFKQDFGNFLHDVYRLIDIISSIRSKTYVENITLLKTTEDQEILTLPKYLINMYNESEKFQKENAASKLQNALVGRYIENSSDINMALLEKKPDAAIEIIHGGPRILIKKYYTLMTEIMRLTNRHMMDKQQKNVTPFFVYNVSQYINKEPTFKDDTKFKIGDEYLLPCYKSATYNKYGPGFPKYIGMEYEAFVMRILIDRTNVDESDYLFIAGQQHEVIINAYRKLRVTHIGKTYVKLSDELTVSALLIDFILLRSEASSISIPTSTSDPVKWHAGGGPDMDGIMGKKKIEKFNTLYHPLTHNHNTTPTTMNKIPNIATISRTSTRTQEQSLPEHSSPEHSGPDNPFLDSPDISMDEYDKIIYDAYKKVDPTFTMNDYKKMVNADNNNFELLVASTEQHGGHDNQFLFDSSNQHGIVNFIKCSQK
jgi:hypothetical protein